MSLSTREFLKQVRAEAANNFIDDAWYLVAVCLTVLTLLSCEWTRRKKLPGDIF